MPSNSGRSGWVAVVLVVVALLVVGAVGFGLGSLTDVHGYADDMPMRGFFALRSAGLGLGGLVWSLLLLGIGVLFVVLVVRALDQRTPPPPPTGPGSFVGPAAPPPTADGLDQLRSLAELHDQGKLTDEEFTAAKRKLLGL